MGNQGRMGWGQVALCSVLMAGISHAGVFETDQRFDIYELKDPDIREISRSVFTFTLKENLVRRSDGRYEFVQRKLLQEVVNLCADERFAQQSSVGTRCSGFLAGPDLGVTAGHCVAPELVGDFCAKYYVVFDYRLDSGTGELPVVIEGGSVRECTGIQSIAFDSEGRTDDYAVFKLSAPVLDRSPLKMRREGKIGDHDEVFMVGHPKGLPQKVSLGRSVEANADPSFFSANLDCFRGNSGSPVVNAKTLAVEGIFVRGQGEFPGGSTDPLLAGDFYFDSAKRCNRTLVCRRSEGCTAVMDSTRITRIRWN
jgi:hypothetical protein